MFLTLQACCSLDSSCVLSVSQASRVTQVPAAQGRLRGNSSTGFPANPQHGTQAALILSWGRGLRTISLCYSFLCGYLIFKTTWWCILHLTFSRDNIIPLSYLFFMIFSCLSTFLHELTWDNKIGLCILFAFSPESQCC